MPSRLPAHATRSLMTQAQAVPVGPIWRTSIHPCSRSMDKARLRVGSEQCAAFANVVWLATMALRSEERRVGKECVSVDLGGRRIIKKKKQGRVELTIYPAEHNETTH